MRSNRGIHAVDIEAAGKQQNGADEELRSADEEIFRNAELQSTNDLSARRNRAAVVR